MKTKLILIAALIMIFSSGETCAQAWKLIGNAGTDPSLNFLGTTDNKPFKIKTNNNVRLFIKGTGEIGVGTSSPTVKFDVNGVARFNELRVGSSTGATGYIASIAGKLIAEEVRVDLQAVWPDYVFESHYDLMSIDQLKEWVEVNKHLPGIPAASEIKEKGIMLGEMQTKTMQKMEEAFVYIIQLNAENKYLKATINSLQKQIDELSSKVNTLKNYNSFL